MPVASRDNANASAVRRDRPWFLALVALFPFSVLAFGIVHPWSRIAFAAVVVVAALPVAAGPGRYARPIRALALGAVAIWGVAALALVPVGAAVRAWLQPALAPVIDGALAVAGATAHPLAVDPPAALVALALGAAWITTAVAAARQARQRAGDLARVGVATGVGLVLLAWAQWAAGAPGLLWMADLAPPEGRPFFGTFVNPNHGGALVAALVPLAAVLAWSARREMQAVWGLGALVLAAGAWTSGSRGAAVLLAVGLAVTLAVAGERRVRLGVAGVAAALVVAAVIVGPHAALAALTDAIDPGHGADLYTRRPDLWADASTLVAAAPAAGIGPGGFAGAWPFAKSDPAFVLMMHAHQEPLQLAIEHGLPVALGLTALLVAVAALVARRAAELPVGHRRTWLAGYAGSAAALLAFGLFDFPFRLGALAMLGALVIGTLAGLAAAGREHDTDAGRAVRLPLLAMAALALGFAAAAARAPDHAANALALERSGDHAAAEAAWKEALRVRPLDAAALRGLARTHHARGDHDGAVAMLTLATRVQPTLPWAWVDLARVHRARRDPEASRDAWRRVLALNAPGNDEAGPWLREALTSGRDPLLVARSVLPDRDDRRCEMADLLATLGRKGAREASESLFAELAAHGECKVPYAIRLVNWGRPEEGLAQLEDVEPGCDALRTRGNALVRLERHDEALVALEAAMRTCGSSDPLLRLWTAQARLATGDRSGLPILERLVDDDPAFHPARRLLWRELAARGRHREAATHLEALVAGGVATTEEQLALDRQHLLGDLEPRLLALPGDSR